MKKNIWEEIANQYNISLEEEFIVEEKGEDIVYKFTEKGLVCVIPSDELPSINTLHRILSGEFSIVPLPWKPEIGDTYWTVDMDSTRALVTESFTWNDDMTDFCNYYCDNCFKTREEAQAQSSDILAKLWKYYHEKEV